MGWPWTSETPQMPDEMPDGRPWPRISIVTPSYHQRQFLEETIRSILLQGYPNLEYIIVDGSSTDGSVELIQQYDRHLAYWVSEPDSGQAAAINKGFEQATGTIYAWINSDDILYPSALSTVADFWSRTPSCNFLTGDGCIVNETGRDFQFYIRATNYSFTELLHYHAGKYLPQPSVFFSAAVFRQANGLDAMLSYAMDLDLWLRLRRSHDLHYVPVCLSKLRSHAAAKTRRCNDRAVEEVRRVTVKHLRTIALHRQLMIRLGMRSFHAATLCRSGVENYLAGNRPGAIRALRRAISLHPPVLLSAHGMRLMLRLILPAKLKQMIFTRY
jgi:glycosyltransferase involved in cell wall biosynthesis